MVNNLYLLLPTIKTAFSLKPFVYCFLLRVYYPRETFDIILQKVYLPLRYRISTISAHLNYCVKHFYGKIYSSVVWVPTMCQAFPGPLTTVNKRRILDTMEFIVLQRCIPFLSSIWKMPKSHLSLLPSSWLT